MRFRQLVAVLLLFLTPPPQVLFAATVHAVATGNSSSSSTWAGGSFPSTGDAIVIDSNVHLTLDDVRDWGPDDGVTAAITGTDATSVLSIAGTGELTYRGKVTPTSNTDIAAGAKLHHSSTASHYRWTPSAGKTTTISGSSGSHVTWDNTGASGYAGRIDGQLAITYADFTNIGTSTEYSFNFPTSTAGSSESLDYVNCDTCGPIFAQSLTSTSSVSITNSIFTNVVAGTYGWFDGHSWGAKSSGTRQITNVYHDASFFLSASTADLDVGMVYQDNFCYTSGTTKTPCYYTVGNRPKFTGTNWARNLAWNNVTSGANGNGIDSLPSGVMNDQVFLNSNPSLCPSSPGGLNYNVTFPPDGLNLTFNGGYDEPDCGGGTSPGGDLFIFHKGTSTTAVYNINNWIHAAGQDLTSTSLFTYVGGASNPDCVTGSTCPIVTITRSTLNAANSTTPATSIMGGEGYGPSGTGLYSLTDSILYAESSHTAAAANWITHPEAIAVGAWSADYNARFNLSNDPYGQDGATGKVTYGGHDQSGDPLFVRAPTANKFLNWCHSVDNTITSWQDCRAKFATHTAGFTTQAMLTWIRAGWAPQAAFIKTMSSTGGPVGAVDPASSAKNRIQGAAKVEGKARTRP